MPTTKHRVKDSRDRAAKAGSETTPDMEDELADIAKHILFITTLETQGSDRLDFHDLSIGQIRAALEAAYAAGKKAQHGRT